MLVTATLFDLKIQPCVSGSLTEHNPLNPCGICHCVPHCEGSLDTQANDVYCELNFLFGVSILS